MKQRDRTIGLLLSVAMAACYPAVSRASTESASAALAASDFPTALRLFREAAGAGDTRAQVILGQLLLNGKAGVTDPVEALTWYNKAAAGNPANDKYVAIAEFNLAALYWSGQTLPKDPDRAVKLYLEAASNGFAQAQETLVGMYFRGQGVKADNVEALKWALVLSATGDTSGSKAAQILRQRTTASEFAQARAAAQKQFPNLAIPDASAIAAQQPAIANLPPEDPAVRDLPFEKKAQHYLDAQDYVRLSVLVDDWSTASDGERSLDFLRTRMAQGETIEVAYLYARNVLRLADLTATSAPPQSATLKVTAALFTTYAFAVIDVDGQKCKDRSAPGHNIEVNLSNWGKVTWAYLAALSPADRDRTIQGALAFERKTAPLRKLDRMVCGGGMEEFRHTDFSKGKEVPTPPGGVGKTIMLPNDPSYVPELLPASEYGPAVEKARAGLPVLINGLVGKIAATSHP